MCRAYYEWAYTLRHCTKHYTHSNIEYELKVYPNPSQSYVYFEIEANKSLEYSLNIYNAIGSLVYTQKEVKDKLLKVNVVDLSNGIYYYSIGYKNELVGSGKFVKQ